MHISRPAPDVTSFADAAPIPGLGVLPVNAFVLHAEQPMLIDTGLPASRGDFLEAVGSVIDPADLRWIYLTHPDRDHTGSLMEMLAAAPAARIVTTFMGLGILGIEYPITPDRVYLLNPGQDLDLGDRKVTAFRPPLYDSPATTGFSDGLTGTCFSSDCFGAPLADAESVTAADIADLGADDMLTGQRLWATVDSPWVASVDRAVFAASLEPLRSLDAPLVLSTPPARRPQRHAPTTRHARRSAGRRPVRGAGPNRAGKHAGPDGTAPGLNPRAGGDTPETVGQPSQSRARSSTRCAGWKPSRASPPVH